MVTALAAAVQSPAPLLLPPRRPMSELNMPPPRSSSLSRSKREPRSARPSPLRREAGRQAVGNGR